MEKYCWKCGKKIDANAQFCTNCGANQNQQATAQQQNYQQSNYMQSQAVAMPYNETRTPGLIASTKLAFKDTFKINKCMGRADYWWSQLGMSLLFWGVNIVVFTLIAVTAGGLGIFDSGSGLDSFGVGMFIWIFSMIIECILIWICSFTATVRRLHDAGYSGWHYCWTIAGAFCFGLLSVVTLVLTCLHSSYPAKWPRP